MEWNPTNEELKAIREVYAREASDAEFTVFISECRARGLRPGTDVVLQTRKQREFDPDTRATIYVNRSINITTIVALRKLAERTGKYGGPLPSKWVYLDGNGAPTVESAIPLPKPNDFKRWQEPWAVVASIKRKDFEQPVQVVGRFWAYAQQTKKGDDWELTSMWRQRGPEQLEKCAKAAALREAFPEELGGLYVEEEIGHEDEKQEPPPLITATPESATPTPVVAPTVNQAPAEPSEAPRPGEKKATDSTATAAVSAEKGQSAEKPKGRRKASEPKPASPEPETKQVVPKDFDPFDGKPKEPVVQKADEQKPTGPPATPAERKPYIDKLQSYSTDKEGMKAYLAKFLGCDWKLATKAQWEALVAKLDSLKVVSQECLESALREAK